MLQVKGFVQFASSALMVVFMSGGTIIDTQIVDPNRYDELGAQRVIRGDNPWLASHCVFQGTDKKHGVDIFYCGW